MTIEGFFEEGIGWCFACVLYKRGEDSFSRDGFVIFVINKKFVRGIILKDLAFVKDQNLIIIDNCAQPVGHSENSATWENLLNFLLNEGVRLKIHVSSGLIKDDNLGPS